MRVCVCVCVSIVVNAGGAPPPNGVGGGAMFGCYGSQRTQWRHEFVWCHGVRCPRTPRCHPIRPGSGYVNHVRCTTATEPRRPLQQHCTYMQPRVNSSLLDSLRRPYHDGNLSMSSNRRYSRFHTLVSLDAFIILLRRVGLKSDPRN